MSFFLKEISDREPQKVLSKISLVVNHLDQESYVMRNGIIMMIGTLIEKAFNEPQNAENNSRQIQDEDIDQDEDIISARNRNKEKNKKTKNDLFDMLETRILDINSYTRSKVLQTWSQLIQEKIVPVTRLCKTLIPLVRDRLQDKAALVRKQAIQILTVIVKKIPWGPLELDNDKAKREMELLKHEIKQIENSLSELELKLSHKLLKKQGIEFKLDQGDGNEDEDNKEDLDRNHNHNHNHNKKKRRRSGVDSDGDDDLELDEDEDEDSDANMKDLTDKNKNKNRNRNRNKNADKEENDDDEEESEDDEESLEDMVAKIGSFDKLKTQRKQLMMLELFDLFTGAMSECD